MVFGLGSFYADRASRKLNVDLEQTQPLVKITPMPRPAPKPVPLTIFGVDDWVDLNRRRTRDSK